MRDDEEEEEEEVEEGGKEAGRVLFFVQEWVKNIGRYRVSKWYNTTIRRGGARVGTWYNPVVLICIPGICILYCIQHAKF